MGRLTKALVLGIAVAAVGMAAEAARAARQLDDDLGLRWLFTQRGPIDPPSGVVVVSVDRPSSEQLGLDSQPWPPSRHVYASLIRRLSNLGVSAIVMDVFFREERTIEEDDDLAAAISDSGRVLLFERLERQTFPGGDIVQIQSPLEKLRTAAVGTAPFPLPDTPQVNVFWTVFEVQGRRRPTLPAAALAARASSQAGANGIDAPPPPEDDRPYLNFYGPAGHIRTIPFHELLSTGEPPSNLSGAVVFVGESTPALLRSADQRDTYRTVFSSNGVDMSGVEIAATAFANLLTDSTLRPAHPIAILAILVGVGVLGALLASLTSGFMALAATAGLAVVYCAFAQYLFATRLLLPLTTPVLVQLPLALLGAVVLRYRNIRKQVFKEIDPNAPPETVYGVCLASDIENYTSTAGSMEPADLARLMTDYYSTMTAIVKRLGGLMMGRAGDSAMCVWTAVGSASGLSRLMRRRTENEARRDACARACLAALEIRDAIDRFNERHPVPLRTRIGLHDGQIALGPIGGEFHVVGDIPNAASRIEGLNKLLGTKVLASASVTRELTDVVVRPVGRFALAGKAGEMEIVEILGLAEAVNEEVRELCRRFREARATLDAGNMTLASALFHGLSAEHPDDGPTRYYAASYAAGRLESGATTRSEGHAGTK